MLASSGELSVFVIVSFDAVARYTEVKQLRAAICLHYDVFGLDVAVEDAARMSGIESFG
jgi:hypothetical protein